MLGIIGDKPVHIQSNNLGIDKIMSHDYSRSFSEPKRYVSPTFEKSKTVININKIPVVDMKK